MRNRLVPLVLLLLPPAAARMPSDQKTLHALNRLTFGPRAGDIAEVKHVGLEKWINQQLHPETIPENPIIETKLHEYPQQGNVAVDLIESKLLRAIYSNRQLNEILVDFWYNHFNVFFNK